MPKVIKNYCKLFADDAKLYARITCKDDNASLQEDLNRLTEWSLLWELPFNEDKCKCMHIGKQTFISYERLCSTKCEGGEGSRNTR